MAIALDSANNGGQVSNTVLSWDHTCGAGASLLVVCIGVVDSTLADRTISGVTYNGDALTDSGIDCDDATNGFRTEIWYRINPDKGAAYTITVTAGGKCTDIAGCSLSVTGTDTTDPIGQTNTAATTGTNPSCTVSSTLVGSWLIGALLTDESNGANIAVTGSESEIGEQDVGADVFNAAYRVLTFAGDPIQWTGVNNLPYVVSAVEILAGAGGGGFNSKIMVDGVWKAVTSAKVMVDGAWKEVNSMKVMVDGAWKAV